MGEIIVGSLWIFLLSMGMLVLHRSRCLFRDDPTNKYMLTGYFAFLYLLLCLMPLMLEQKKLNLFDNISGNNGFLKILLLIVVVQISMTYFGGEILRCYGLTATEWLFVVVLAFTIIPVDLVRKLIFKGKN